MDYHQSPPNRMDEQVERFSSLNQNQWTLSQSSSSTEEAGANSSSSSSGTYFAPTAPSSSLAIGPANYPHQQQYQQRQLIQDIHNHHQQPPPPPLLQPSLLVQFKNEFHQHHQIAGPCGGVDFPECINGAEASSSSCQHFPQSIPESSVDYPCQTIQSLEPLTTTNNQETDDATVDESDDDGESERKLVASFIVQQQQRQKQSSFEPKIETKPNPSAKQLNHHSKQTTTTLRPHSTPATLMWLENNYELADGVCIPRSVLYLHYIDFCQSNHVQPVNAASFGKIIRQQFPQLTTRRLGTRGQSRYHYYGIAIKEESTYYQLSYSKKSVQLQCGSEELVGVESCVNGRKYTNHSNGKYHHRNNSSIRTAKSNRSNSRIQNSETQEISYYHHHVDHHLCPIGTTQDDLQPTPVNDGHNLPQQHPQQLQQPSTTLTDRGIPPESSNHKQYRNDCKLFGGAKSSKLNREQPQTIADSSSRVLDFNNNKNGLSHHHDHHHQQQQQQQSGIGLMPVLPPFPTNEELQLCHSFRNNLVPTFLLMYRAHCQRILDAIVRANFEEVHTLVHHFWQQIPPHLISVLSTNLFINLLAICDIRLYRTIIKIVSITFTQPLSEVAYNQLEHFANSYDSVLQAALPRHNIQLLQIKLELAAHFTELIKCLLRHCRLFQTLQNQLFNNGGDGHHNGQPLKQLQTDWQRLNVDRIATRIVELCHKTQLANIGHHSSRRFDETIHNSVHKYLSEFQLLLINLVDCSQVVDWFEHCWQCSMQLNQQEKERTRPSAETRMLNPEELWDDFWSNNNNRGNSVHQYAQMDLMNMGFSKNFLMIWTFVKMQIIDELQKTKATSHDLFITFGTLFDDFCVYKIQDKYFDHCIHWFNISAAHDSKPSLPPMISNDHRHYFDPNELIRQTTALVQSFNSDQFDSTASLNDSTSTAAPPPSASVNHLADFSSFNGAQSGATSLSDEAYYEPGYPTHPPPRNHNYCPPLPPHPHQQPFQTTRQDSLICFSMNFHANSIQVMTSAATSATSIPPPPPPPVPPSSTSISLEEPTTGVNVGYPHRYGGNGNYNCTQATTCYQHQSQQKQTMGNGKSSIRCYFTTTGTANHVEENVAVNNNNNNHHHHHHLQNHNVC